jgi:hypothetical protein
MRRSTFLVAILAVITVFSLDASAQRILGGRKLQLDDNTGRWIQLDNFNRTLSIGNTAPPSSSIFYVEGLNPTGVNPPLATPRGVLFAPMATANRNAILTPADGLLIYNTTTHAYEYYNSGVASWQVVGGGWSLTGNSIGSGGTAFGQSFIGTTDAQDFVLATNTGPVPTATGTGERIRVTSGGNIGINDAVQNPGGTPFTPLVTLHVNGVPPTNTGDATPNIRANSLSLFPQMTPALNLSNDGIVMGNNAGDLRKYDVATVVGAVAWLRTGNTISDGNNLLGTLNGVDINVITNNTNALSILAANQNVGINNMAPTYKLDVNGTFRSTGNSDIATGAVTSNSFGNSGNATNAIGNVNGFGITTNSLGDVNGGGGITTNNIGLVTGGGGIATTNIGNVTGAGGIAQTVIGQASTGGIASTVIGSAGAVTTDIVNTTTINNNFSANTSINTGTSNGNVAIATGATSGSVNIGSTTHTGAVSIASTNASAITLNVASIANNLIFNNINTDNTTVDFLTLTGNPSGNVRLRQGPSLVEQGITFNAEGTGSKIRLGGLATTDNPFLANRFVNLNTFQVNYTGAGGVNNLLRIDGNAANTNVVTITNPAGGAVNTALKITGNGENGINIDPVATGISIDATVLGIDVGTGATKPATGIRITPAATGLLVNGTVNTATGINNDMNTTATNVASAVGIKNLVQGGTTNAVTGLISEARTSSPAANAPAIGISAYGQASGNASANSWGVIGSAQAFFSNGTSTGGDFSALGNITSGQITGVRGVANSNNANTGIGGQFSVNGASANNIGVDVSTSGAGQVGVRVAHTGTGLSITGGNQSITDDGANTFGNGVGADAFTVSAGTGAASITSNAVGSSITLDVTSTTHDLTLNNILNNDLTPFFLGLTAVNSGNVRTITAANLADEGIQFQNGKFRLGANALGTNPIVSNRIVTINNGGTLNFDNSAGNNLLGFTAAVNTTTIGTDGVTTTEIRGATNINNNFNGSTNINTGSSTGSVAIATGATAGTVNIGSATHTGAVTIASNTGSAITLNVASIANNLALQNIATDATTTQFLTLTGSPSGNVRLRGMGSLADQGLIAQAEANDGGSTQVRLGVRATDALGTNALVESRVVYLGGQTLNFSNNAGGAFLSLNNAGNTTTLGLAATTANTVTGTTNTLTASAAGGNTITASAANGVNTLNANGASGQNNINATGGGSNNIAGTTNVNAGVNSNTNINTGTSTGSVAIATGATAGTVNIGSTTHTGQVTIASNPAAATAILMNVGATTNNLALNNILEDDATQYFLGLNAGPNNGNVRTINSQNLAEQGLTWTNEAGVTKVRLGSLVRGAVAGGNPFLSDRFVNLSNGATGHTLVFGGFANTGGTDLLTLNAGAGVNSIGIIGTTTINALGTAATSIGTSNGAVNIGAAASAITIQGAPININNSGGDNGTVNIGNSGIGGPVNVFLSGVNDFTVDLGTLNSSDFIIHDLDNNPPPGVFDLMVIDGGGSDIVRRFNPTGIAQQGLTFNTEAPNGTRIRLGGLLNTDNPLLANRFVNLDVFQLTYTGMAGANNIFVLDGNSANTNVATINNPANTNTALKINANGGLGVVVDPASIGVTIDASLAGISFTGTQPTTGIDLTNGAANDGIVIDGTTPTGIAIGETLPGTTGMTIDASNDGLTIGANTAPIIGANVDATLTGIEIGNTTKPSFGLVSSGSIFGGVFEAGPTAGNVGVVVGLATSPDIGVDVTANNIGVNIGSFIAPTTGIEVRAFGTGVDVNNGAGGPGLNIFSGGTSITTDGTNTFGDGAGNDAFTVNAGTGSANINSSSAINLTGSAGANIGVTTNLTGTISLSSADGDISINQTGIGNVNIDPTGTGNINIGNNNATGNLNLGRIASIMNWNSQTINAPNIPLSATYTNVLVIDAGQIKKLSGALVTASNGIYINGTNDVRLGTNPLIEPTTITGTTFPFAVNTTDGGIDLSSSGTGPIGLSSSGSGPINIATTGTGSINISTSTASNVNIGSTGTGNVQLAANAGGSVGVAVTGGGNAGIAVGGTGNASIATAAGSINIASATGAVNIATAGTGNLNFGNAGSVMNWGSATINAANIPASGGIFNRILVMTAGNQIQTALASSFITAADNGLHLTGSTVELGGPLNQATTITGTTFPFAANTTSGGIGLSTSGTGGIAIATSSTGNIGIASTGAGGIAIASNNTGAIGIGSSGSGAINIGTTGTGPITLSTTTASNINIQATAAGTGSVLLSAAGGGNVTTTVSGIGNATMTTTGAGNATVSTSGSGNVSISTSGTGTVQITPGANIGAAAAPNSTLQVSGSFAAPIRIDNNVTPTAGAADYTIVETANVNVTLPAAVAGIAGRIYCIKNTNAAGGAIAPAGADLIDGVNANFPLVQNQSVIIQCGGAGVWYILSTQ